jgi:hypothetical protein
VDESARTANIAPQPQTPAKRKRVPQIFATVGVVIALAATGLYLLTGAGGQARLSPEETVGEFLAGVFLANDPQRVAPVVCASWDPADAIARTTREIDAGAHVSWDNIAVVSNSEGRVSAKARLGLRLRDDRQPSTFRQWRFNLVDEHGWRVCDARPFN